MLKIAVQQADYLSRYALDIRNSSGSPEKTLRKDASKKLDFPTTSQDVSATKGDNPTTLPILHKARF